MLTLGHCRGLSPTRESLPREATYKRERIGRSSIAAVPPSPAGARSRQQFVAPRRASDPPPPGRCDRPPRAGAAGVGDREPGLPVLNEERPLRPERECGRSDPCMRSGMLAIISAIAFAWSGDIITLPVLRYPAASP